MNFKTIILALLAIGMALMFLMHFALIWMHGSFFVYESNIYILVLETLIVGIILIFSFYCFLKELNRSK